MSLTINFTPSEEATLEAAAQSEGIEPTELLRSLVARHLTPPPVEGDWQARLRQWQEQDGVQLLPEKSTQELFSEWAANYDEMTEAERAAEDHLWEDVGKALLKTGRTFELDSGR